MKILLAAFITCYWVAVPAGAVSTFGKNKVHYYGDDWYIIQGDHVDLYFYESEKPLAEIAVGLAEEAWDEYTYRISFTPAKKIPLVIYSSHAEFEDTNILPYILPEGVGGFTELFKNRVVVPFDGSYGRFRRVLRHEIAHYFLFEKLRDVYSRYGRYDYGAPPFWYTEGFSEYFSGEEDAISRMVMADAVYNAYLTPLDDAYGPSGYLAYKEGESALRYLAERYGEDKIVRILEQGWLTRDWRQVLDRALPVPLDEFDRDWRNWLRHRYYARYAEHEELRAAGRDAVTGGGLRNGVAWLDHNRLVYFSDETGHPSLYVVNVDESGAAGEKETLIRGGNARAFAAIRVYRERPGCWGGNLVAFAARAGARDRLYLYDVAKRRVVARYEFQDLAVIGTPSFSPDGAEIAFRGLTRSGRADIYVLNRATGEKRRLTDDDDDDAYPCWTARGIIFSSSRGGDLFSLDYNLYCVDGRGGEPTRLTDGVWQDLYAQTDDAGRVVFTSDRDGMYDVYCLSPEGTTRLTRTVTGILEAALRPGDAPNEAAVVTIHDGEYKIAVEKLPDDGVPTPTPTPTPAARGAFTPKNAPKSFPVRGYESVFGLDYFSAEVAYGPEFGTQTGAIVSLTDILNDQDIIFKFGNDAEDLDDFFARTSVGAEYYNLRGRVGWGVGAFRYLNNDFDYKAGLTGLLYTETRTGVGANVSLPLDRFHRVGASLYAYEMKREWEIGTPPEYGKKISPYLSATRDTSLWHLDGPIDGDRANVTVGVTEDVNGKRTDYTYLEGDLRYYYRTTLRQCFAFRLAGLGTFGPDARPLYAGGSLSLRGYDLFSFRGRRFALFNAEYRFPVLEPSELRTALGPAFLPPVRGALFCDAGRMWDDPWAQPEGWRGGFGVGFRVVFWGVITLRTDHTVITDFEKIGPFVPIKFFVGWSY